MTEMAVKFPSHRLSAWRAGPRRLLLAVLGLAVLAGAAERFAARAFQPGNGARWIWAAGDVHDGEPIAFYAVRELELEAPVEARIAITADDTYLLHVNGQRLGAGHYRQGAPLDEYEVGDFLESGTNRILIEARSSRGAGGLIAELELGPEGDHETLVTDSSWRIFERYDPGLFGGRTTEETGTAPRVWGRPPTGRWRLAAERRHRPILFQGFPPPERRRPLRHKTLHGASWLELDAARPRIPALGPQQIFDWGEELEGIVSFDLRSDEGKPGLLYASAEPPDVSNRSPDAVIVPVPGRRFWQDALPRRFRYLLLVGVEPASRIEVDLLDGAPARAPEPPGGENGGVFGVKPPRSYSKTEEAVWERLEEEAAEQSGRQ